MRATRPPGDAFTYNSLFGSSVRSGQAVGSSGWYYNNVGGRGSVGINGNNPHSGNGSVSFSGVGNNSKADIEFLANPSRNLFGNYTSTGTFGPFSMLSSMSYDWYRNGTSTADPWLHPSLRVLLDLDGDLTTTGDRGGLVFEGIYNGVTTAPTDQWVSSTVGGSTNVWNFGLGLGTGYNIKNTGYGYDTTLAQWQAYTQAFAPNAAIIGFSSGIGGGWGPLTGAVDNIGWTIGGVTTTTNFELRRGRRDGAGAGLAGVDRAWAGRAGCCAQAQAFLIAQGKPSPTKAPTHRSDGASVADLGVETSVSQRRAAEAMQPPPHA